MLSDESSDRERPPTFATTRWSMVLHAASRDDPQAKRSLETLCQQYWLPIYAFVRRRAPQAADAQDLTQAFFLRLLEKESLSQATPTRGRFRSFLLASLEHFLANERERQQARKRGGGLRHWTIDFADGESRFHGEPADAMTPELAFDRQWVTVLLDNVMQRLQTEYEESGRSEQFACLKAAMTGERPHDFYRAAAADLGLSPDAARQAVSRLRKRYRELLRAEVSQTVENPGDVDDEIRQLFAVLGD